MRWWLALATASFVGYFALLNWSHYYVRRPVGASFPVRNGQLFVRDVIPESIADQAGLRSGDRVISAAGWPMDGANSARALSANYPAAEPVAWVVDRDGQQLTMQTAPAGRELRPPPAAVLLLTSIGVASLTLGLIVMWRRSNDPTSLLGGMLLASLACASAPLWPRSIGDAWRALPVPIAALIWPAAMAGTSVHVLLVLFFARIRRPAISTRALWLALLPAVLLTAYVSLWMLAVVLTPASAAQFPIPRWVRLFAPLLYPGYFVGAIGLLATGLRGIAGVTERRRARILLAGTIIGTAGLALIATDLSGQRGFVFTEPRLVAAAALFMTVPVSFAYATLRYRLFDLHVIVRQGLRYALARGAVLGLVPLSILLLLGDLARHGKQPFFAVVQERGWTYAAISLFGILAYAQRSRWMTALDRRFFREHYVAQRVLAEVIGDIARARALDEAARMAMGPIATALRPTFVAWLTRSESGPRLEPRVVDPPDHPVPALDARGALAGIVRALGRPVVLTAGKGGLRSQLPADDAGWLAASGAELVIPVSARDEAAEAWLLLGPRRSEQPYTSEDLDLLSAVAASLSLIARQAASSDARSDGTVPIGARRLNERYRLERVIGEGGMGTVWEGLDESLNRPVAVKLLKAAGVGGHDTARFQREAQSAAALTHPNVVIVHDYGVDAQRQPFIVMERLVGETLRNRLVARGRLVHAEAAAILTGVAAGLSAAHARNVVHRDMKPENVFLCAPASHVKILDFGIARSVDSMTGPTLTTDGAIIGTCSYMAPEQLAGGSPVPRWDVWALSVMAYEMLTGVRPIGASGGIEAIQAILSGRFDPVAKHLSHAPPEWQSFFDRVLAGDLTSRPATPGELAEMFVALPQASDTTRS